MTPQVLGRACDDQRHGWQGAGDETVGRSVHRAAQRQVVALHDDIGEPIFKGEIDNDLRIASPMRGEKFRHPACGQPG